MLTMAYTNIWKLGMYNLKLYVCKHMGMHISNICEMSATASALSILPVMQSLLHSVSAEAEAVCEPHLHAWKFPGK